MASNGDFGHADLLRRFKNEAGLADASELDDTLDIYPLLSDGQLVTNRELAGWITPNPLSPLLAVMATPGLFRCCWSKASWLLDSPPQREIVRAGTVIRNDKSRSDPGVNSTDPSASRAPLLSSRPMSIGWVAHSLRFP